MNSSHWLLFLFWMLYCIVHSLLANIYVKHRIQKYAGQMFRYYRLAYSLFASITLILIIWYQFSFESIDLFSSFYIQYVASFFLIISGSIVMIICIKKYFYELSGIQALQKVEQHVTLQQTGLHNYVRHPLYSGTLLFVWGLFLMFPLLSNLIACIIITLYVLIGIQLEENQLVIEFGEAYTAYAKKVPMLFPSITRKLRKK